MLFKQSTVILFLLSSFLFAQQEDTVKTYDLEEITVESGITIEPKQTVKFEQKFLTQFDGRSVFEAGYFMPSIKPQTNSRGESLFYIRGSNERQLGLFFDGAYLNIPWDNRIDLSLLPTASFSELKIIKGIPSVIYGANNVAGVIVASSRDYQTSKFSGNVSTQFGDFNQRKLSLTLGQKINKFSFLFSASHYNRDSYILPKNFSSVENPSRQRINSYQQTDGLFAKVKYHYQKRSNVQVAFQYLNSDKGVPPEIDVKKPRYWQYPEWNKIGVNIFGQHSFSSNKNSFLDYVFNVYNFKMEIDQFTDQTYSVISNIEKDNDLVLYGKLIYTTFIGGNSILRFSFSGYNTTHKEKFLANDFQEIKYVQNVYSAGAEYEYLTSKFTAIIGASLDGTSTPQAGTFENGNSLTSLGLNLTTKYLLKENLSLQLNLGEKSRFPSLRESYSTGLGRFIVNPGLNAETAYDGELGLNYTFPQGNVYTNIFLNYLQDGIVREVIHINGEKKFMRVNKAGIQSLGFELQSNYSITQNINAGFQFSYISSYAKNNDAGEYTDTLEYKPRLISSIYINYSFVRNFSALFEATTIQDEYGYREGYDYFRELPSYYLINFRLTYYLRLTEDKTLQFYGRVNNIFDELYYTQWGLPEAGRQFTLGVNFEF